MGRWDRIGFACVILNKIVLSVVKMIFSSFSRISTILHRKTPTIVKDTEECASHMTPDAVKHAKRGNVTAESLKNRIYWNVNKKSFISKYFYGIVAPCRAMLLKFITRKKKSGEQKLRLDHHTLFRNWTRTPSPGDDRGLDTRKRQKSSLAITLWEGLADQPTSWVIFPREVHTHALSILSIEIPLLRTKRWLLPSTLCEMEKNDSVN